MNPCQRCFAVKATTEYLPAVWVCSSCKYELGKATDFFRFYGYALTVQEPAGSSVVTIPVQTSPLTSPAVQGSGESAKGSSKPPRLERKGSNADHP